MSSLLDREIRKFFSSLASGIIAPLLEEQLRIYSLDEVVRNRTNILEETKKKRPDLIQMLDKLKPMLRAYKETFGVNFSEIFNHVVVWFNRKGYNLTYEEQAYIYEQLMSFYEYIFLK